MYAKSLLIVVAEFLEAAEVFEFNFWVLDRHVCGNYIGRSASGGMFRHLTGYDAR